VPSYTVGYIDVYRNGVRLVSTDYTATTGTTVVLSNACTVGDAVVTESFLVSSVLNAIPATAGSVSTSYLVDGSVTTAKIADANVTQAKLSTNVVGNGPVFSACATSSQALTQTVWNKVNFGTELFDTNNNFASSRFTPTVAGYYQISANINFGGGSAVTDSRVSLYKNGSVYVSGTAIGATNSNGTPFTGLAYANGSTDYFEIYAYTGTASTTLYGDAGGPYTTFQGVLVRSA
jgi:hypothetical protein